MRGRLSKLNATILLDRSVLSASISPLSRPSSAAVGPSLFMANSAGQKMMTPTVVAIADFLRIVRSLDVTNAARTLADRKAHRENRDHVAPPLIAIGFGYTGLVDLTPGATMIESEAFKIGLPGRSAMLGDPQNPSSPGSPTNWVVGAPGAELDAMVIVAGDDRPSVDAEAQRITTAFEQAGATTTIQRGDVRPDLPGHEHFGFDDGVSQPGIRGRASAGKDDFITPRHVAESEFPAFAFYGYPGQDLVWPGEFVIGYPRTSPDPLVPGPIEAARPNELTTDHFWSTAVSRKMLARFGALCATRHNGCQSFQVSKA